MSIHPLKVLAFGKVYIFHGEYQVDDQASFKIPLTLTLDFVILLNIKNYALASDDSDKVLELVLKGITMRDVNIRLLDLMGRMITICLNGRFCEEAFVDNKRDDSPTVKADEGQTQHSRNGIAQSRELLQSVIDAPAIGLAVYKAVRNDDGRIVDFIHEFVNKTTRKVLGTDFTGKLLSDHGEQGTRQLDKFITTVETGKPLSYLEYTHFDGSSHWVSFTNSPLDSERLVHMWEDISERKRADMEVLRLKDELAHQAEEKYHRLFNSIDQGYALLELIFDSTGTVIDFVHLEVNPAEERLTGRKGTTGKRMSEIAPIEDHWLELYGRVAYTGVSERKEFFNELLNRWFSVYSSRVGGAGSKQIIAIFDDITERKRTEERQAYLLKLTDALHDLSASVDIKDTACRVLAEHLGVSRAMYSETVYKGDLAYYQVSGQYNTAMEFPAEPVPVEDFKTVAAALFDGNIVVINDVLKETAADEHENYVRIGIRSFVTIPLIKKEKPVLFFGVYHNQPKTWRKEEIKLVEETAERTWAAVERARAEKEIRINEERMRAMKEAYKSAANGEQLSDSLNRLAQLVTKETNGEARSTFYMVNKEGTFLNPIRGAGSMQASYLDEVNNFPIGENSLACGLAIPTGQPVISVNVFEDPRWKSWVYIPEKYGYRSCWSFPIKTRFNKAVGTFSMYFRTIRESSAQDLALAELITRTAAVIISNHTDNIDRAKAEQALAENEQKFRSLVEAHAQAVWETNAQGEMVIDSPTWRNHTGQTFNELKYHGWMDVIHPDDRATAERLWRAANAARINVDIEFRLMQASSATYRWTNLIATPIIDADNNVSKWFAMNIDVSDRKAAEEQKEQFLAIASHELKTPVTSIKAYAELLEEMFDKEGMGKQATFMNKMNTQLERLVKLIEDLLDTTRITGGKLKLQIQTFDLSKLLKETIEDIQRATSISLILKSPENITVNADKVRINQVITNLLSNAIKYSKGAPSIIISCIEIEDEIRISVQDFGIGMTDDTKGNLFGKFFRAHDSSVGSTPGLGLGLHIAQGIITKHGGKIWMESEIGQGSTFYFSLLKDVYS